MSGFIINHSGRNGSCVDVQNADHIFEAVCAHRRFFSGRVQSVREIKPATPAKLWDRERHV